MYIKLMEHINRFIRLAKSITMDYTNLMGSKPIIKRSLSAVIGYILSPLSWWNDLYINFPIAYGMAWIVSLLDQRMFAVALVASYWITNIAGLILLHKGLAQARAGDVRRIRWYRKKIVTDLVISVVYTGAIILLLHLGFLKLPQEYFFRKSP